MAGTGAGLEGIIAAESEICYIDGEAGILSYNGFNIHTLAENATFEEVIFLLWNGRLPKQSELAALQQALAAHREIPPQVVEFLASVPKSLPMDVLRTAVSMLSLYDPLAGDNSTEANQTKAVKLMSQTATIVTTFDRLRKGLPVVAGDPSLGFAANFLYTLNGTKPEGITFVARVTAATLSDIHSAVTSAIGALKGPLHGGANEDVIKLLLGVGGEAEKAVASVKEKLANKVKIPGFGHRVYKTEDPRATHLRHFSEELGRVTGHYKLYEASSAVEQLVKSEKKLNANVDFYSASTYYSLGIPVDLFTPIFAVSRMSGWTAHVLEQYRNNRLIRPRADYKGKEDGQAWVAIENR
jgi:citrate synthase